MSHQELRVFWFWCRVSFCKIQWCMLVYQMSRVSQELSVVWELIPLLWCFCLCKSFHDHSWVRNISLYYSAPFFFLFFHRLSDVVSGPTYSSKRVIPNFKSTSESAFKSMFQFEQVWVNVWAPSLIMFVFVSVQRWRTVLWIDTCVPWDKQRTG